MASIGSYFDGLVPSWWTHLGKVKSCGLVGGRVSLGVGFNVLKATSFSISFLFIMDIVSTWKFSATTSVLRLPASMLPAMNIMNLPSKTISSINSLFYEVPWSWCLKKAIERELRQFFGKFIL